jgi:hypothetical protein
VIPGDVLYAAAVLGTAAGGRLAARAVLARRHPPAGTVPERGAVPGPARHRLAAEMTDRDVVFFATVFVAAVASGIGVLLLAAGAVAVGAGELLIAVAAVSAAWSCWTAAPAYPAGGQGPVPAGAVSEEP